MNRKTSEMELNVLRNISKIVDRALNLDQALDQILEILNRDLVMRRGTIALKNGEKNQLAIRASLGTSGDENKGGVYRLDEEETGLVFHGAQPFAIPREGKGPLFVDSPGTEQIDKDRISMMGVPIVLRGTPIGVLRVDRLFDATVTLDEDIRLLNMLATFVAQFVHLNDQVRTREDHLVRANLSLKSELSKKCAGFFSVSASSEMIEVKQLIRKVAPTSATVLLVGESGTGKTLVGQIIHELSKRSRAPFVKINAAVQPDSFLEEDLFGYEKGAVSGSPDITIGRIEEADGGTVFLDEIGELSMPLQAKLMRLLQDREYERVGSTATRNVDIRVIASTNTDLGSAVQQGTFRQDLYYRLDVFPIVLPPLRDRQEDLDRLLGFFSEQVWRRHGCRLEFSLDAKERLKHYTWPGNVGEMENLVERLAITWEGGCVEPQHLDPFISKGSSDTIAEAPGQSRSLLEMEKQRIVEALERNHWIQSRAARELGITLRQIGYRLKKYQLEEYVKQRRAQWRQFRDENRP
jgi:Nif-specific regulatory protein